MRARWVTLGAALAAFCASASAQADPPPSVGGAAASVPPPPAPPPEDVKPPRPPLPPAPARTNVPWERHVDVGVDLAFIERPASTDAVGNATNVRYEPAPGYGVHARIDALRYFRFGAYILAARHHLDLPPGALGWTGTLPPMSVLTYSLGGRIAPTLPFGPRARAWLTAGIGWGRLEVDRIFVTDGSSKYEARERSASFVEYPLGLGASFDAVPRWVAIELETTAALHSGQEGDAIHGNWPIYRTASPSGPIRHLGGFPMFDASLVETLGVSIIL